MLEGAIIRPYKAGSIIYFEGDRGEDVYVLQQGGVRLMANSIDGKEEIRENVKKGEFFGVKSSLGHFPREETAQVLIDSVVLVFNSNAFQQLCIKNVRLVLQVLKVLSSQLRKIHKQVRAQLGESETLEQSAEFLRIGEYYFKNGQINEAKYVFEKFMEHYQDSSVYDRAMKLKQVLNEGQPYPEDLASMPKTSKKDAPSETGASAMFYEGLNLVSQENTDAAIEKFKEILNLKSFANSKEAEFLEKAHFEICRCYLGKGDTKRAIANSTEFVKKYPNSDSTKKVLFLLAQSFENENNFDRAIAFYTKVASMLPKDKDSSIAAKKLEKLEGK